MRSDLSFCVIKLSIATVLFLPLVGCGGGDATDSAGGDSSASKDAVQAETEQMMGMGGADGAGDPTMDPAATGMGAGDSGDMAMMDPTTSGHGMEADAAGTMGTEMEMQMEGYSGGQPGGPGVGGMSQKPPRPADVAQWTDEQLVAAAEERDPRILQALQVKAENTKGNPEFAKVMTRVLQQGAGVPTQGAEPNGGAASGAGLPGLNGLFGGSGDADSSAPAASGSVPAPANGKPAVPPGGASYHPGMDSLEVMLGEALLSYVPQAVQGTRGAAERLQGSVSGSTPEGASGSMPSADPATDPAAMESMMEGMQNYGNYADGSNRPGNGKLDTEQLVHAVAKALVINNTPEAWDMLKGMATGSVPTSLPPATNIEIVLAEIFAAETINLPVAEQLLGTAMMSVATAPAEHQSTMRFLAALAQNPTDYFLQLSRNDGPPPVGGAIAGGGGVPGQPGSVGMGVGTMDPAMMESSQYDGGEMAGGPGMTGPGMQPGGGKPAVSPLPNVRISEAAMIPVATALWNKPAVDAVVAQLLAADSPAAVPEVLAFASTIPTDSVRQAMFTLFEKSHQQGAAELSHSGLFQFVARDPGMMTVLKSLPRPRPVRKAPAANGNVAPVEVDPTTSWTAATQEVVLSLRDRLREVSDVPELKYDGLQRVRLHRDAVPQRSIVVKASNDKAKALGDAAPSETTIYYTSCVVSPMRASDMQAIVDHYEKRIKGIKHEDRNRGILWYDGVKENEDGTLETMDVIVEQVGAKAQQGAGGYDGGTGEYAGGPGAGGPGVGGPVQFNIEVVVVITKNPEADGNGAAVTTNDSPDTTKQ
ncbi:MAG: hypothetical protein R3C59_11910 [Planctomycetaceae bacterium]